MKKEAASTAAYLIQLRQEYFSIRNTYKQNPIVDHHTRVKRAIDSIRSMGV